MRPRDDNPADEALRMCATHPAPSVEPHRDADLVLLAEEAIRIVMRARDRQATDAADLIQHQAAQHNVSIEELTGTIVELAHVKRRSPVGHLSPNDPPWWRKPAPAGTPPLEVRESRTGRRLRIDVEGELDLASGPVLRRCLARHPADPSTRIIIDLAGITFIDCAGLRPLLEARNRWEGLLVLSHPARPVTHLLDLAGLNGSFDVVGAAGGSTAR